MPSAKRNAAKPEADMLVVNDDGTIDLRVKGEMIYLRTPTGGELEKLQLGHARVVHELAEIGVTLAAEQERLLAAAKAVQDGEAPVEDLTTIDETAALELLTRQRRVVADYWADEVIKVLAHGTPDLPASDLPAWMSHVGTIGRALQGWYGLPSAPGIG